MGKIGAARRKKRKKGRLSSSSQPAEEGKVDRTLSFHGQNGENGPADRRKRKGTLPHLATQGKKKEEEPSPIRHDLRESEKRKRRGEAPARRLNARLKKKREAHEFFSTGPRTERAGMRERKKGRELEEGLIFLGERKNETERTFAFFERERPDVPEKKGGEKK